MESFSNLQIEKENIPKIEEAHFHRLENNYITTQLIETFVLFVVVVAAMVITWYTVQKWWIQQYFQWMLLGVLVFFFLLLFITYKSFNYKGYAIREKDISYKKGWLWRTQTTVPFNRVQHCEVSQGILDRYFGLGKIKIYTAGGSSSDVTIPGLFMENALELKAYVLEQINKDE